MSKEPEKCPKCGRSKGGCFAEDLRRQLAITRRALEMACWDSLPSIPYWLNEAAKEQEEKDA